jgi:hypothetical protein
MQVVAAARLILVRQEQVAVVVAERVVLAVQAQAEQQI